MNDSRLIAPAACRADHNDPRNWVPWHDGTEWCGDCGATREPDPRDEVAETLGCERRKRHLRSIA